MQAQAFPGGSLEKLPGFVQTQAPRNEKAADDAAATLLRQFGEDGKFIFVKCSAAVNQKGIAITLRDAAKNAAAGGNKTAAQTAAKGSQVAADAAMAAFNGAATRLKEMKKTAKAAMVRNAGVRNVMGMVDFIGRSAIRAQRAQTCHVACWNLKCGSGHELLDSPGLWKLLARHFQVEVAVVLHRVAVGIEQRGVAVAKGLVTFGAKERQADIYSRASGFVKSRMAVPAVSTCGRLACSPPQSALKNQILMRVSIALTFACASWRIGKGLKRF